MDKKDSTTPYEGTLDKNSATAQEEVKEQPQSQTEVIDDDGKKRKIRRLDNTEQQGISKRQTRLMSRESSFVRQSSMLSEISQAGNIHNLNDLLERFGSSFSHMPLHIQNEPYGMMNRNGDKYFDGIDEDIHDNSKLHPNALKPLDFGIRDYNPASSFRSIGNNSFKLEDSSFSLFKKPNFQQNAPGQPPHKD